MPNYNTRQMEAMFKKLQVKRGGSNHHISGFVTDENGKKLYPPIFFSKGAKELPPRVERNLMKCLCINASEFDKLISCKMSREEYLKVRCSK